MANALTTYAGDARAAVQSLGTVPSTVAIQIFTLIGPGLAAGFAGFLLAYRLSKTPRVTTGSIAIVSLLISIVVLGSVLLVKPAPEKEAGEAE